MESALRVALTGTPEQVRAQLAEAGVQLNVYAEELLDRPEFARPAGEPQVLDVELRTVSELGLTEGGTLPEVFAAAEAAGLELCPLAAGPALRLALLDQESAPDSLLSTGRAPTGSIHVASAPVSEDDEVPKGFYLRVVDGVPWLRGYRCDDQHVHAPDVVFAFARARASSAAPRDIAVDADGAGLTDLEDFVPSANQRVDPQVYEIENRAMDRERTLWTELRRQADWRERVILDLGCGSGYWLPHYEEAAQVIGVEPDPTLIALAERRPGGAVVLRGSAEHIPLADASVDVVHARFAYFFPRPRFDPSAGLREVARVLRDDGTLIVIDNDTDTGEFADLLRSSAAAAAQGQDTYARQWWATQGAVTLEVLSSWTFDAREDLEAVLRLEFPTELADSWLADHPDRTALSYGYLLHRWRRPSQAGD